MAWLEQEQTGIFQICFRYEGERFKRSAHTKSERKANNLMSRLEENLELLERGRLELPEDADLFKFLMSDGKIDGNKKTTTPKLKLGELFDTYHASLPPNALANETLRLTKIHMNHIVRVIGPSKKVPLVERDDLQAYINKRAREDGLRKRPVSAGTIQKELSTFRTLWRWAQQSGRISTPFPSQGLKYPLQRQKFPFSTWEQIENRIQRGLPSGLTEEDLWDCLYLNKSQLDDLLEDLCQSADYGFLHPMCFMAAHTGARRSELCRSMRDDIDFENGVILIREKKRAKGKETFRHVPMSGRLSEVLSDWLSQVALSAYTFPAEHRVSRNRNENRRENLESVSPDEATDHLTMALKETKWTKIRGWHIFRHSFISLLASNSTDQRMIDAWVGHQTEEMRRRYRHLFPNRQKQELEKVFG